MAFLGTVLSVERVKAEGVDFSIGRCFAWLQLFARSAVLRLVRESIICMQERWRIIGRARGMARQCRTSNATPWQYKTGRAVKALPEGEESLSAYGGIANQFIRIRIALEWL